MLASYRDINGVGFGIPNATFQVQLSPKTILVPVYVIRAMSSDTATPTGQAYNTELSRYSVASYKQLFDDQTPVSIFRKSHPNEPYAGTDYAYLANSGTTDQVIRSNEPDDIWAQCGIQFRMVPCEGMEFGCPTLLADNAHIGLECSPTDLPQRELIILGRALQGVKADVPMVIATYSVSTACLGGTPVDVARGRDILYSPRPNYSNFKFTLAHELGHVLGLEHLCVNGTGLMCPDITQLDGTVPAAACIGARKEAAIIASQYWGVPISP